MKVILFALIAICLSMSTVAIVIGSDPSTPPPPPPSPSVPVSSTPTAVPTSVPVSSTPRSDPISVPVAVPTIDAPIATPVSEPITAPIDTPIDVPVITPVDAPIDAPVDSTVDGPIDVPVATPVTVPVNAPVDTPVTVPIAVPVTVPVAAPVTVPVSVPVAVPVSAPIPTPVAPPVAAPNPVASAYIGCFEDSAIRDLPFKAYTNSTNTNVRCIDTCSNAGYAYAATQNGNECWCGHSYGSKGQFNDQMCKSACAGDATQHCGGGYKNSVYRTPSQRYIGCFRDSSANRDLKRNMYKGFVYNTPQKCMTVCSKAGYVYAGLQTGTECWCGNTYGSQGRLSESSCNIQCSANWSGKCGGAYINSVYRV